MIKTAILLFFLLLFMAGKSSGQWTQQTTNISNDLKDIHFLNDSVGFVIGNNGAFLKTYNRGENWNSSVINGMENINSVYAIDPDTIFAGSYDHIYKSTDGGQTWNVIYSQLSVNELKFFSSQVGFAKAIWEEECGYPNSGSAYRYKYYRTLDGGNTWNYFEPFESHTVSWAEMEIVTPDTGYMGAMELGFWCGYWPCCESASNYFYKTTDGGFTWQELSTGFGAGVLTDVSFMNGLEGFAMREYYSPMGYGYPAELFIIKEGGDAIDFVHAMPDYMIGKFFFANTIEGYYLQSEKIMKTTTEGYLWSEDYSGTPYLTDVVMTENLEAYVIGNSGTILHRTLNPVTEPDPLYWMSCDKSKLQFPMTNINEQPVLNFTLAASGNKDITVNISAPYVFSVKTEGAAEFVQEIQDLVIPAHNDTTILVVFRPPYYGNFNQTIQITSNATNNPLIIIPVYGKGVCFLPQFITNDTLVCFDSVWVRSNVTVEQGSSLSFCPGTVVNFQGGYQMNINGSLTAVGNVYDSIRFTCVNKWGGMFISGDDLYDSVILEYCRLSHCNRDIWPETDNGGGMNITGNRHVSVSHTSFIDCGADDNGGGIYCTGSGFRISNSKFFNCGADRGGAIYYESNRKYAVSDCLISDCGANDYGGGIYCNSDADSVILNCTISDCSADYGGGMYLSGNEYSVHSCEISNCSGESGGGIFAGESGPSLVEGCRISDCYAVEAAGIKIYYSAKLSILNCDILGCESELGGGGIFNAGAGDNLVKNCIISGNRVNAGDGGGILVMSASPSLTGNEINYNNAFGGAGAGIGCFDSSPLIMENIIYYNNADSSGGGIYIENWESNSTSRIIQNLLYGNFSCYGQGGGIYLRKSFADILMNTITENNSNWYNGDGIYCNQPEMTRVYGNIIYNNDSSEFDTEDDSKVVLSYCDIKGGWQGNGTGNIDEDPGFYGLPYYPWYLINVDFSIMPESPCVDAGITDTLGLGIPSTDFAGNPRIVSGRMDIGAYENNFVYQSIDTGFCQGQDFIIEVIPIEEGPFNSVEWTLNGEVIPGADSTLLLISNPTDADVGYYQCKLYGEDGLILDSRTIYLYNKGNAPEVQDQPIGAFLNEGDDYELVFAVYSPDNALKYQWYLNDSALEGEDERVIYIYDFSKEKQGTYKCLAENTCGELWSNEATLTLTPSAIDEYGTSTLAVYPNPASSQLAVRSSQSAVGGQRSAVGGQESSVNLNITDLFGRKLKEFDGISSFPFLIDISELRDGLYILQVVNDQGETASSKFLKISE